MLGTKGRCAYISKSCKMFILVVFDVETYTHIINRREENCHHDLQSQGHSANPLVSREAFLRKNIVAVSFFLCCAIHPYS